MKEKGVAESTESLSAHMIRFIKHVSITPIHLTASRNEVQLQKRLKKMSRHNRKTAELWQTLREEWKKESEKK